MGETPAIGIDLGTTNSCVAVVRFGKVEVIANEQGYFITPSYVAFTDDEILIGDAAKKQVDNNPQNTIFDAKRLIGRKFDDKAVQKDMKYWPFLVKNADSEPRFEVMYKGEKKLCAPEEISAMILNKMKEIAESYLNEEVKDAVITVPAYFNNAQRQATKDAAEIAGLSVLRILNEPTAAALAYKFNNHENFFGEPNILVYDLGGGTFDVSIMNGIQNSVVASSGNTHLGGEDFDCRLVNFCVQEFKRKYKIDLEGNRKAIQRLRTACEAAKRELSSTKNTGIELCALSNGIDFSLTITRARFEDLNSDDFKKTLGPVQASLDDAKLNKDDINIILLVGGSTRVPKIQRLLQEFFGGKPVEKTINPDEAVAYGAAVYAAVLKGDFSDKVIGKVLQDITPLSLGEDVYVKGIFTTKVVIPRNTPIPVVKTSSTQTIADNQKNCLITIRQGESSIPEHNHLLGRFNISGLPEGRAGSIKFETVFEISADGILTVNSTEQSTGNANGIVINNVSGHLRKAQVGKMIEAAAKYRSDQRARTNAIRAKDMLAEECYMIMDTFLENEDNALKPEKENVLQKCEEIINWLEENPCENQDSYETRYKVIIALAQKVLSKIRTLPSTD